MHAYNDVVIHGCLSCCKRSSYGVDLTRAGDKGTLCANSSHVHTLQTVDS